MFFNKWLPAGLSLLLLCLAVFLLVLMHNQDKARIMEVNRLHVESIAHEIMYELDRSQSILSRAAKRWEVDGYANSKVWDVDAERYYQDIKGLRSINFVDKNFIIRKIHPFQDNEKTLNFDLKRIPHAKSALEQAVKTGEATTTSFIELIVGKKGFVVYQPIIKNGKNIGFVSGVFEIDRLFNNTSNFKNYNVKVKAFGSEEYSVKNYPSDEVLDKPITVSVSARFHDTWTFEFYPLKSHLISQASFLPYLTFLGSLLIIMLIFYVMVLYIKIKEKEKLLQKLLDWQRFLVNSSSLMFVSADEHGIIRSVNTTTSEILGYTEEELVGIQSPEIWHDAENMIQQKKAIEKKYGITLERDFDAFLYEARMGIYNRGEFVLNAKSGKVVYAMLEVHCSRNEDGVVDGYVGILEDITLQKQQEQKIREQEAQVISSTRLAALGEMAAGVGHEINNPLAIISANVSLIKRDKTLSENALERLGRIESTVQRIAAIIKGLRSLSRQSSDNDQPEKALVSDIVMDAVYICSERIRNSQVSLTVDPFANNLIIVGYHYQLSQVLLNLISNSFDALMSSTQEGDKWIRVGVEDDAQKTTFYVHDSGQQLSAEVREKLFQPFFTTKEVGKGLGLGLSISLAIAKRHGGRLYVDSNVKTTCFKLEIPKSKS